MLNVNFPLGNQFVLVFKRNCKKVRDINLFISPPGHKVKTQQQLNSVEGSIIIIFKLQKHTWFIDNSKCIYSMAMTWKTVKKQQLAYFPEILYLLLIS